MHPRSETCVGPRLGTCVWEHASVGGGSEDVARGCKIEVSCAALNALCAHTSCLVTRPVPPSSSLRKRADTLPMSFSRASRRQSTMPGSHASTAAGGGGGAVGAWKGLWRLPAGSGVGGVRLGLMRLNGPFCGRGVLAGPPDMSGDRDRDALAEAGRAGRHGCAIAAAALEFAAAAVPAAADRLVVMLLA